MRAALYARVSTKDGRQTTANQIAAMREYGARIGAKITAEYLDEQTGSKGPAERLQLRRMLSDAHAGRFDAVIVWDLSRLTREGPTAAFQYLEKLRVAGVEFHSVTEPHFRTAGPAGELLLAVAAWIAKQERATIAARVKAGLTRARAQGKTLGRPAIAPADRLQILNLHATGHTLREIAIATGLGKSTIQRTIKGDSSK